MTYQLQRLVYRKPKSVDCLGGVLYLVQMEQEFSTLDAAIKAASNSYFHWNIVTDNKTVAYI